MTYPITTQDIDVIYDFFNTKFNYSKGKDAYFMLSKVQYSLMQIRPVFDKTVPELQARFCYDLYQLLQMPNYCINCLKFIDDSDLPQKVAKNVCPICGVVFCGGFCSSDLKSHPCETLNKVRLRSMLFYPEIATIKLRTDELANYSLQRSKQQEELFREVCAVKVNDSDAEDILNESYYYLDVAVIPRYSRLYNSVEQTQKEQAKQQVEKAVDPFLFPYFVRICKLYSDNLTKLRANANFIERGIVDLMQATRDLTHKQIKLINGINDFIFILQQLEDCPTLARIAELAYQAKAAYYLMTSTLTIQLDNYRLDLPAGVRYIIEQLHSMVYRHIYSAIAQNLSKIAAEYKTAAERQHKAQAQWENALETEERYQYEVQRQDKIIAQAEKRTAELIMECYALYKYNGLGIFDASKYETLKVKFYYFFYLKQSLKYQIIGFDVLDETQSNDAAQNNGLQAVNADKYQNKQSNALQEPPLTVQFEFYRPRRFVAVEQRGIGEEAKTVIRRRILKAREPYFDARIPVKLHEAQLEQYVHPQQDKMFTRRIVFVQDDSEDIRNIKATVSMLEQELRAVSQNGNRDRNRTLHCPIPHYAECYNVMKRSRSLRKSLEDQRQAQRKIMCISTLRHKCNGAADTQITLDTRLLHPFYKQFINQLAIETCRFKTSLWRLLVMLAFVGSDVPNHASYIGNLYKVYANSHFLFFCKRKRLWLGYNNVCQNVSLQRMQLEEKNIILGSESRRRLRQLMRSLDSRVLSMPAAARKEVYQKLRGFVFDLVKFDDFEGVLRVAPVLR